MSIDEFIIQIKQALKDCVKSVQVNTINGSVHIDKASSDFSYINKFGNNILTHCISEHCINDIDKKLLIVAAHAQVHCIEFGSVNIVTK